MARKRRAFNRTMTLTRDIETQEITKPSLISRIVAQVKAPFSANWWEERFSHPEAETLVDNKLLSYAYLEAGMIEMLGAYVAYAIDGLF